MPHVSTLLPVTLSKSSHRARRSCYTCGKRQDQDVHTPGPQESIPPSCRGDMWHHRSKVQGLSEGAWQTFKDGDWGTKIVCLPNAENFRCHSNWECNISNCIPPCQCNNLYQLQTLMCSITMHAHSDVTSEFEIRSLTRSISERFLK